MHGVRAWLLRADERAWVSRPIGRWPQVCIAAALTAVLAACGGGGGTTYVPVPVSVPAPLPEPVDLLAPYRDQALNWELCDPTILGADRPDLSSTGLSERLRCAYLRAPLDYENPSRGEVSVAMMRLSVADPAKKRGTLFVNPGGPGQDGLGLAIRFASIYLAQSDPSTDMGALQLRLLAEYDVMGFSPRGTGASTRLECGTNEIARAVDGTPEGRTAQAIEDMLYNARKQAEACRKNPITPYINSETISRDMDLMRGLIGEERLNYWGGSWGTWLGGWYAARFPERVGRMVLDSNMNFINNDEDGDFRKRYAMGFQRVWEEVYAPYAARHPEQFGLGATAQAVRDTHAAIRPQIRNLLIGRLVLNMYAVHRDVERALLSVAGAAGLSAAMDAMPGAQPQAVFVALDDVTFVPGNATQDARARGVAKELIQELATPRVESVSLPWGSAVLNAVKCNDTPAVTDIGYWIGVGNEYALKYPLLGSTMTESTCAFWGGPSVTRPEVSALAPLDILMVQSQFDGPTSVEGAREAFAALPNGHMVYVEGEATHGVFPYLTACVDGPVIRYLLGESPRVRETVCEAKPLPLDAAAQQASGRSAPGAASGFKDARRASELIGEFKKAMLR